MHLHNSFVHLAVYLLNWTLSQLSFHPTIYEGLADLLFITTSHIQLWPLYETTVDHRGQKYEINHILLPHWPFSYWAAVKLSCYTVWMAPDGNCLEMADKFTCWAEVQNPLASSSAVSEREWERETERRELTLTAGRFPVTPVYTTNLWSNQIQIKHWTFKVI